MKYIISVIEQIPKWRWIMAIILILGSSFEAYTEHSSFYEMLLGRINDPAPFILYFIFLLLIADFGFNENTRIEMDGFKDVYQKIMDSTIICTTFLLLLVVMSLFTLLISGSLNFNNEWIALQQPLGTRWLKPLSATLILIPIFFLKFCFITMTVIFINKLCKRLPFGFLAGFIFCVINAIGFYDLPVTQTTGWLFPFGYSDLEFALNHTGVPFYDITICIFYWLILILIISLIMNRLNLKRREIKNERNHL